MRSGALLQRPVGGAWRRARWWAAVAAVVALGATPPAGDPLPAETAEACSEVLEAFLESSRNFAPRTRRQTGSIVARAWDEDGEPLGTVDGELTTYHAPATDALSPRFQADVRLVDDEGTVDTASFGVDGKEAWAYDPDIGVRAVAGLYPEEFAIERDLVGAASFDALELDPKRLASEDLAEGACPVSGFTRSGVAVEGRIAADGSSLDLSGRFTTPFGPLEAKVRLTGFGDAPGCGSKAAYRTELTSTEIVKIEQTFVLDSVVCDLPPGDLPGFSPPDR